jgi:dipeptidyl aminopeptidase/acylaminoacyl peptidase
MRLLAALASAAALLAGPTSAGSLGYDYVIATAPAWSPDRTEMAYAQQVPGSRPRSQLVVASATGRGRKVISTDGYAPKWSPDGSLIAFLASDPSSGNVTELWIADVQTLLGGGPFHVASGVTNFAWSADGQELFYDQGWNTCSTIQAVSTYDFARRRTVVTGASPLPSPDGRLLAYFTSAADRCTGGFGDVTVANADGTNARVVLAAPAVRAAWSPDSAQLAIELQGNDGPSIELVRADGSDAMLAALGSHPSWSPDGRRLAFLSRALVNAPFPRDEPSLQILDVTTGVTGSRLLSASAELKGGPVWSPGGDQIALSRALERGGVAEGISAGLNRYVSVFAVPVSAPARARRVSLAPCELLLPRCTQAGGPGGNVLEGTRGRDLIWGYGGDDRIAGDAGDDRLHGGSGNDVIVGGAGRDVLASGSGGDLIFTRDGAPDAVYCGSGYDTVIADPLDSVARDCERVVRN